MFRVMLQEVSAILSYHKGESTTVKAFPTYTESGCLGGFFNILCAILKIQQTHN